MNQELIKTVKIGSFDLEYKIYKEEIKGKILFYVTGYYAGGLYEEWWNTLEEAEVDAMSTLKKVLSGEADREYTEYMRTANQERGAESYGTSRLYGY